MAEEKIYIGNGKSRRFDNGGETIKITVDVDSILKYFEQFGFTTDQGKRKIKLDVTERRSADNYGNTHAVTVDTWKPDGSHSSGGGTGFGNQQQSGQSSFGQSQPAQNQSFGQSQGFHNPAGAGQNLPKFESFGGGGNHNGFGQGGNKERFEDDIPF